MWGSKSMLGVWLLLSLGCYHVKGQSATPPNMVSNDTNNVHFYLYPTTSNINQREEIMYGNAASLSNSSFKPRNLTIMIIHDTATDANGDYVQSLKNSYLAASLQANILIVDWSDLSTPRTTLPTSEQKLMYSRIVDNVQGVGVRVAGFIQWLVGQGLLTSSSAHVIGLGMGAQVGGEAGNEYRRLNGGATFWRITGLDPIGPYSSLPSIQPRRLTARDAGFVDIVHSNGGQQGDFFCAGHADFYPNGGSHQPNCDDITTEGFCSHKYAIQIYAASLFRPFKACQCNPVGDRWCQSECKTYVYLGPYLSDTARGTYTLSAANPP